LLAVHIGGYLTAVFVVLSPLQAVVFLVVQQGLFGVYMGYSFAPNHKGMPVVGQDEKVDFLRRQVLTSRNTRGSLFTDGGVLKILDSDSRLRGSVHARASPQVQPAVQG
jgi:hypothetical protein